MNGQDIKRARESAGISQTQLAEALKLTSRGSLTDVESCGIEVTDAWVLKAIGVIHGLSVNKTAVA